MLEDDDVDDVGTEDDYNDLTCEEKMMQREILKNFISRTTVGGKKSSNDGGDLFSQT